MSGNVFEWVWDRYQATYDSSSPAEDPPGPSEGSNGVNRGGPWNQGARDCRAASRNGFWNPSTNTFVLGFRPARSAP